MEEGERRRVRMVDDIPFFFWVGWLWGLRGLGLGLHFAPDDFMEASLVWGGGGVADEIGGMGDRLMGNSESVEGGGLVWRWWVMLTGSCCEGSVPGKALAMGLG